VNGYFHDDPTGGEISEYIEQAGLTTLPLFRARLGSHSQRLADRHPGGLRPVPADPALPGTAPRRAQRGTNSPRLDGAALIYTSPSLRATTATLLLDANVDIVKVKDLLGHRHVTTAQIYDKRRRSTSESASHLLAIWWCPLSRKEDKARPQRVESGI